MILALTLLAQYAGTVVVTDRTEVRARATDGAPSGVDAVTIPTAQVAVVGREWQGDARYTPTISISSVDNQSKPIVFQSGGAAVSWHSRRVRLTLGEQATYGTQNSALLIATGAPAEPRPPPIQFLTAPVTIQTGSSRTTLSSALRLERRWTLTSSVGFGLSGGLDDASRALLPSQRNVTADAVALYRASAVDSVSARAAFDAASFGRSPCAAPPLAAGASAAPLPAATCEPQVESVVIGGFYQRRLARPSTMTLGAAVSGLHQRQRPEDPATFAAYPVFNAGYQYATTVASQRAVFRFDADLTPVIDNRTGLAQYRAQGALLTSFPLHRFTIRAGAGASTSAGSQGGVTTTLVRGDGDVEYRATPQVSFGGGVRGVWQHQEPGGSFASFVALAFVTVALPVARF